MKILVVQHFAAETVTVLESSVPGHHLVVWEGATEGGYFTESYHIPEEKIEQTMIEDEPLTKTIEELKTNLT